MAIEYKTQWHVSWLKKLNQDLPKILNNVKFDIWQSELSFRDHDGIKHTINGQKFLKIIITCDEKEVFVQTLKGNKIEKNFPELLQAFIYTNLEYDINRKYIA